MKRSLSSVWLASMAAMLVGGIFFASCSKPESPTSTERPVEIASNSTPAPAEAQWKPPAFRDNPVTNEAQVPAVVESSTNAPVPPEVAQQLADFEKEYRGTTNSDLRSELLPKIKETGSAGVVRTLERLFLVESDADMRTEIINTLFGITDAVDERLHFLALGIAPGQPPNVREAAIEGLVDTNDPRALAMLKKLLSDPDPAIKDVVKHSYELLDEIIKSM